MNAPGDWIEFYPGKEIRRRPAEIFEAAKAKIANEPNSYKLFLKDVREAEFVHRGNLYRVIYQRRGLKVYVLDIQAGDKPFDVAKLDMFLK